MRAPDAWYLIQCKSRQDERAQAHLQRQGYTCFRATCTRQHLFKGRLQTTCESLFPGYLFIQMSPQASWSPLRSTRGVLRVVTFGAYPLPVSDALVQALRARDHQALLAPLFTPGEPLHIDEGPLAGRDATFLALDGDARVVVLMRFLHREQPISLSLADVSARARPTLVEQPGN